MKQERTAIDCSKVFTMNETSSSVDGPPAEDLKLITELTDEDYDYAIKKSKKLKIVTTCIGEMGHFIPMLRLVDALEEAGHEVVMFTNKFNAEKVTKFARSSGIKAKLVFPDDITRDQLI